jgi:DNA-binding CsgD family transcriptional regulator
MRGVETRILDVINRCYAGVLDENAWQEALIAVADLVGGTGTLLFAMQPVTRVVTRFDVARFDPEVVATYNNHWVQLDLRAGPAFLAPVGAPQTEEMLLPAGALRRSAIYNDFLLPVDAPHFLVTLLHRSPDRVVELAIQGTRQRGAFTTAERDRLETVVPHVTRAIELKDRLALDTGVSRSLITVADALPLGLLLIDAGGRILEASRVGRQILAAADGLFSIRDRLAFRRRVDERALARLLSTAAFSDSTVTSLTIPRQHSAVPLSVFVAPVRSRMESWMTAVQQWVVAIEDPGARQAPRPDEVAREWQITPAEARVVCLLAGGASAAQISAMLHVSEHTVRSQLKSVYAKTGMTSQLEVVRRLLSHAIGPSH